MGCCSDSDDDEELLFGPVCTTLGDSSNDALNAPECPEFGENAHKEASIGGVCMARLYCIAAVFGDIIVVYDSLLCEL